MRVNCVPAEEGKEMTMPTNVDDIIRKLSPAQRKKVEARAAQLIEIGRAHV